MSYLGPLRLHFAGRFQAAVSTVNNDPVHFDNSRFLDRYQDRAVGYDDPSQWNGWFNPRGDATWRLVDCAVTGAWAGPATSATNDDPVGSCLVADSDRGVPAKLVDLDPEQQLVSMIFGLEVRIVTSDGAATLVRGRFDPTAFTDIWSRAEGGGADNAACAAYQSVLTDLEWGDIGSSSLLSELRDSAVDGLLSIKFNVDAFNMDFRSPHFMHGRIVGTIGPATADEPRHLVLGRHLLTTSQPTQGFFLPTGGVNFCVGRVDPGTKKIYLDLGNALPTTKTGALADLGLLTLACVVPTQTTPKLVRIDDVTAGTYTEPSWYLRTAGVIELPAGRELTADELDLISQSPLAITATDTKGVTTVAIAEPGDGLYLRADQFVFRMDPGDHEDVRLYATRFGQAARATRVVAIFDPSQLQGQAGSPLGPAPSVATPDSAIDFPARLTTDDEGVALLRVGVTDPGNPRGYIDGQVYGVRPVLEETIFSPDAPYPFNPSDFISLLVWDDFSPSEDPVTWWGSLQPVLQQFENLYPVMKRFVRLGDYDSVWENKDMLLLAFGLDVENPNHMPVTRDLSSAKRAAIVRWLSELGPDAKPLMGTPPPPADQATSSAATTVGVAAEPSATPQEAPGVEAAQGGKAAALSRRLVVNRGPVIGPVGTIVGNPE